MKQEEIKEMIKTGRAFMHHNEREDFVSDQELKKPQPPLVKERMSDHESIQLPRNFKDLSLQNSFIEIIKNRKNSRIFTEKGISLLQLSFLLWSTQGILDIRGKKYATLRTVPSGGARHAFETYLIIQNCESLKPGLYHYLPMTHELEFIKKLNNIQEVINKSLCDQTWSTKADVVFYWTCIPERCEWRYGIMAHRVALIDAGHVGQNLYLACSSLGLGVCAVAAFDNPYCDEIIGIDGDEEFVVYSAPVGTISQENKLVEDAIYQFVKDQNL